MLVINLSWSVDGKTNHLTHTTAATVTIGRQPDSTFQIDHPTVSRRCAELRIVDERLVLFNRSQTNAIRINGQQDLSHDQQAQLRSGDRFRLGLVNCELTYVLQDHLDFQVRCSNCEQLAMSTETNCPWCGTSLAFADTFN
jgi:predicted component of type VI protein secretion system